MLFESVPGPRPMTLTAGERRERGRPCPPDRETACWLAGGACEFCIVGFAREGAPVVHQILASDDLRDLHLTARRIMIALQRSFGGEMIYVGAGKRSSTRMDRDAEIMRQLAAGRSADEVAVQMEISPSQVRRVRQRHRAAR